MAIITSLPVGQASYTARVNVASASLKECEIAVSLAGWTVAGYVYGRITWRALEKKYGG